MKKLLSFSFLAVALALLAVTIVRYSAPPELVTVTLTPGPNPPEVPPGEAGIDPLAIGQAIEYAGAHGTRALLIVRGNHLVVQKYWGGTRLDTRVDLSGFTPALAALALGTAI